MALISNSREERVPVCPEHKVEMVRHRSQFGDNYWYGCPMFPECRITCAEHPDGRLMSTPAGFDLKLLRMGAHDLLEKKFGSWRDRETRKKMYAWLKENSKTGHIGLMDEAEVQGVIDKLKKDVDVLAK